MSRVHGCGVCPRLPDGTLEAISADCGWHWSADLRGYDQGEVWITADGRRLVIAHMDRRHRINCARMLLRSADWRRRAYYMSSMWSSAPDDVQWALEREMELPAAEWMRRTDLYRAMVDGLAVPAIDFTPMEAR